ncbi:SDR family oxidoreductase [Delftia acidovorans]|jgi:NAD(P)-dependent dehydrogenase (short-subunit alcohol dehydrogenase family)|uniref:SDR family NAD(P)-dependent oxidoreductase n=1 Tax=Delftia TaxID=80865 RepID=UPI000446F799|nr:MULTISPECIES: SDR family oxidoreductase [Delftia]EZP53429.1 Short-chain dehydrogenase/reductase SDR [Delftia sp. RIT313]MCG8988270.1 SDR family oxidoreductase [Delftia acidovorans]QQB49746.1 SDR family oxidoreductase [Delftia acidovorans]
MMDQDPFSLAGKRILVTGASSGIGRQVALSCADMGAQLIITGRDPQRLQATADELPGSGHLAVIADLAQPVDLARLVEQTGVINGLVHAAGISRLVPFRMISQAHLSEMFEHNTYAPMMLTKELLGKKRVVAGGSIVFISALASHSGAQATAAYAASKSALLGAMRSLAIEVAKHGIRANCIAPGYVRTPMLNGLSQGGAQMERLIEQTPLGLGDPQDIAYAAAFHLADASRWITGNYFILDGGLSTSMDIYA